MTCTRCGKVTDYYYMAGPVILCEDCACNSVSALADEGLFPFFDNVVPVQVGDGTFVANEEPVPAEERDIVSENVAKVVNDCMEKQKYMDPDKNLPEEFLSGENFLEE